MSLTVTAHVFSGRPDPVWTIPEPRADEFRQQLAALKVQSNLKAIDGRGGLGYRGFTVLDHTGGYSAHVLDGVVDPAPGLPSFIEDSKTLEGWLLQTAGSAVHPDVVQAISRVVAKRGTAVLNSVAPAIAGACPSCNAADAPTYNPGIWNTPTAQPSNNCYNYANNKMTNTFAQPGRATGKPYSLFSCADVESAALSDGLRPVTGFGGGLGTGQGFYVALVIWPGQDFHWYRQDNVGCWSHKPGTSAARNYDNSGNAISDPGTADRDGYTAFCGYMVTDSGVQIS